MPLQLKRVTQPAALVALLTLLAGCSAEPARPAPRPSTTAAPLEADGEYEPPGTAPTWDQSSADAATAAATAAMTLFMAHPADEQRWWAQLQPLLSTAAARDYVGTDPANVPARRLTGPSVVQPDTSAYLATAVVPTDIGDYQLVLSRQGGNAPWLVERLTPPADAEATGTRR